MLFHYRLFSVSCPLVFQKQRKDLLSLLNIYRKHCSLRKKPCLLHPLRGNRHLRRKNIALLQFLYPAHGFFCGKFPFYTSVFNEKRMFTVSGNIFGMMLNYNNRLLIFLIQFFQHFIYSVRMGRIQLGNRFIQNQNIRTQSCSPRQRQQMFLPA